MNIQQPLPTPALDGIRDLCSLIIANASLREGIYRARAARLAKLLDAAADNDEIILSGEDIVLVGEMSEAVVSCILAGESLDAGAVLMRICERIVKPFAVALGDVGV